MTLKAQIETVSEAQFVSRLKKAEAAGKSVCVGLVNIPSDLRLTDDDYSALRREAFHHLSEKTRQYYLESGMLAFICPKAGFGDVDPLINVMRETLDHVVERQGLGSVPDDLWYEFRWPEDRAELMSLLGADGDTATAFGPRSRFNMADMLRGAVTSEAVFDSCRRQAMVGFHAAGREILGHELYCSLNYLRKNHLASFLLEGVGETEILSRVLDEKMMDLTVEMAPQILPDRLHLNMQVQSVFSDHFAELLAQEGSRFADNLAIEFSLENAIADWWMFEDACQLLHSAGVRVGLDRITMPSLEFLSPRKINVDFIKVIWDHNIIGSRRSAVAERLREFALVFADQNLILSRCDSRTALGMGRSLGIDVFQGSYIDAMLEAYLLRECASHHARSSEKRCAVCQWAPREAAQNGCEFHFRTGKILKDG